MEHRWILLFSVCLIFQQVWSCCKQEIHLESLNCCNCNFSTVPLDLPEEVRKLDLSFNPLKHLYYKNFSGVPQLQLLDLTRCSIISIEDNSFVGLYNLHTLILTGNPIKRWAQLTFAGLYNLRRLVIVETSVPSLSELHVENLTLLQEINAATNQLNYLHVPSHLFTVHVLDLRANQISKIQEEDLKNLRFANTSHLTLILSQNPIRYIAPGAFKFIVLHMLQLKECFPHEDVMKDNLIAMGGLNVQKLFIGQYRNSPSKVHYIKGVFEGLCGMDIQELTINEISFFTTVSFFNCMKNLTSLRLIHTNLESFSDELITSNMQKMELKNAYIFAMPCKIFSMLPHLKELRVTDNRRLTLYGCTGENRLTLLDLSRNKLFIESCCNSIGLDMSELKYLNFSYNTYIGLRSVYLNMPYLQILDLSHTRVSNIGQFPIFVLLVNLTYLDLSHTSCHFTIDCSFCGLNNLKDLHISYNTFAPGILGSVFQNLTQLHFLNMSSCNLQNIPEQTFKYLTLLRVLDLSKNKLIHISASVLITLSRLIYLDLSANNFQGLSNETSYTLAKSLVKVDLSENPFDCSCIQKQFVSWVCEQSNTGLILTNRMMCKTPEHLQGLLLQDVNLDCNGTFYVYVGTLSLVIAIAVSVLIYHIYLKNHFAILQFCLCHRKNKKWTSEKTYDAFVIHSSLDEEWVRQQLIPTLENGVPSFQLCVHYRNFQPGRLILENIFYEGICCSRYALVIVSQNFIDSKWCAFEFKLAMFWKYLENKCDIIIVLLEPINENQLNHMYILKKHLKRNTYLIWERGHQKEDNFWRRLRHALNTVQHEAAPLL
ncbi:toll-like receptor 4 [Hyperolius riggenbachi]|uniref:toll-like receptor 4 n=1 Tax=Hyperolius riggenbachi TaxID=752182 RepID=UPI0035A3A7E1